MEDQELGSVDRTGAGNDHPGGEPRQKGTEERLVTNYALDDAANLTAVAQELTNKSAASLRICKAPEPGAHEKGAVLPLSHFARHAHTSDGYMTYCRKCWGEMMSRARRKGIAERAAVREGNGLNKAQLIEAWEDQAEHFTPQELADLMAVPYSVVNAAIRSGELFVSDRDKHHRPARVRPAAVEAWWKKTGRIK